jgi:hypothetical protein
MFLESGIAEGWWQNIIFIWFALCYLIGFPIALVLSVVFVVLCKKKEKNI